MARFDHMMSVLVDFFAIKSWIDLIAKHIILLVLNSGLILVLENTLMPPEDRQSLLELFPIVFVAGTIVSGLLFACATHQARLQAALAELALTDALTGLNNRRAFLEIAASKQRADLPGYLLVMDADHFKRINDTYGHNTGDECLRRIARHLKDVLGADVPIGRLGGEEFAAVLPRVSTDDLDRIATKLTSGISLAVPATASRNGVPVTLSVGMTELLKHQPLEQQLHQADIALYEAKRQGRARLVRWKSTLETAA